MKIAGLQKLTLLDFPEHVSCTVFTFGCNFRCGFCHNPELVIPKESPNLIPEEEFFDFLLSRKRLLDAVCITGGEPTIHQDLPEFIQKIKKAGFKVKLDTNGSNPQVLENLIKQNLLDYIAMDIKASPCKYSEVTGVKISIKKINQSKKIIKTSHLPHQFRTTVVPGIHHQKEIKKISKFLADASSYKLQNFQTLKKCLNPQFNNLTGFTKKEFSTLQKIALNRTNS